MTGFHFPKDAFDALMEAAGFGRLKRAVMTAAVALPLGWRMLRERDEPRCVALPEPVSPRLPVAASVA